MSATNCWEPDMKRRKFLGAAACALASPALPWPASGVAHMSGSSSRPSAVPDSTPFPLSVMLWTVKRELPFDQRLDIVAQAGYHAAELVGEFKDWTKEDYARVRKQRESLGMVFDATSGISSGLVDPAQRDALLKEIQV